MLMDLKEHALSLAAATWGGQVDGDRLMPLDGTMNGTGLSCSVMGNWYVAQADGRREKDAVESVADLGMPAYRPIVVKDEVLRGRLVKAARSMFGGYFFVRCEPTDDNWHRIRTARHVRRLVTTGEGRWLPVPLGAMEVIRLVEAQHADPALSSHFVWHFTVGDTVRIKTGPFAHFLARVESAVDAHGRLMALVDIFGRQTRIQFEARQLEAT